MKKKGGTGSRGETLGSSLFVDVAIPVPLDTTFTYRVPPGWNVKIGQRVLVPFGSKIRFGVVWSDPRPPSEEEESKKIRGLAGFEGDPVVLSPEIRELVQWMADYYQTSIGALLKLALPPGVLTKKEPTFRIADSSEDQSEWPRALDVLRNGALSRSQWAKLAGVRISVKDVREWEGRGWICPVFPGQAAKLHPVEEWVEIINPDQKRSGEWNSLKRSPRQRALMDGIREHGGAVQVSELAVWGKDYRVYLKKLEKKGLIRFLTRKVSPEEPKPFEIENHPFELNNEQSNAVSRVLDLLQGDRFASLLLYGITGSGKTEVYLRCIEHCLQKGKQALILVPEIALTPLMKERISSRFGRRLAILHSAIPKKKRMDDWARVLRGEVDVVLGARSGIFAPLPRLGLIVVDEEHDQSYKQNEGPRYHARDLALVRAKMVNAVVIMGSATPSLESWYHANQGKYELLTLKARATNASLPEVEIVDMREEFKAQRRRPIFARVLLSSMEHALSQDEQVMLLLNRRGFHAFLLCRKCGQAMQCSQCDVTLTYHHNPEQLKCHYCGFQCPPPSVCPECLAPQAMMQFFGEGTQLIQAELQKRFPDISMERLDRDRVSQREALGQILTRFRTGQTRVLIGTQMIAKGHDFHNVTLVGILNADHGLRMPDFRAAESTFQLMTQVAGRSGRGSRPGKVIVQTYMPDHYSIQTASRHDFDQFAKRELLFRENLFYPPYAYLMNLIFQGADEIQTRNEALFLLEQFQRQRIETRVQILGPVKAPVSKIKNLFRFQILVKSETRKALHQLARLAVAMVRDKQKSSRCELFIDMDPFQFQ